MTQARGPRLSTGPPARVRHNNRGLGLPDIHSQEVGFPEIGQPPDRNSLGPQVVLSLSDSQVDDRCEEGMATLTTFSPKPFELVHHAPQELFV